MPILRSTARAVLVLALGASVRAQSGVLDQTSPIPGAGQLANFAVSNPANVWQQQVKAGVAGRLVGLKLQLTGPVGARATLRLRAGAGWSTAAPWMQATLHKTTAGAQEVYVDSSAAQVQLALGTRFVIELVGDNTLAGVNGSYTPAAQGAAQYSEPLLLNGPGCYASCGWRIGFETFVLASGVTEFCYGASCPCANDASAGGCRNSTGAGARIVRSAGGTSVAADDLVLSAVQLPHNVSGLFFMGATQVSAPFGDGLRCAGTPTRRFGLRSSGATGSFALVAPAAQSAGAITPGSAWIFQAWYRDVLGPCGRGVNLSNAVLVDFAP